MFLPEYGQRQYEVTCRPAQGVAAADRAVNVREVTREVARQMGLRTCFAPLPAPGAVTNGVHLHLSLQHADGSPLLYEPGRPNDLSELGEHWAAGVLAHLPALCALTAPTAASYLRLKPHHWSAAYACLGLRNREAALRICPVVSVGGKPLGKQYNLEFRPMDATACPHLAMAAVLIAGRLGIERRLPLRPWPISIRTASATKSARPAASGPAGDPRRCARLPAARRDALRRAAKAAAGHLPRHEAPRTGTDGGPFRRRPVPPLCRALLTTPNSASTSCHPTACSAKGAARWSWSASTPAGTSRWVAAPRPGPGRGGRTHRLGYRRPGAGRRAFPAARRAIAGGRLLAPADRPEPTAGGTRQHSAAQRDLPGSRQPRAVRDGAPLSPGLPVPSVPPAPDATARRAPGRRRADPRGRRAQFYPGVPRQTRPLVAGVLYRNAGAYARRILDGLRRHAWKSPATSPMRSTRRKTLPFRCMATHAVWKRCCWRSATMDCARRMRCTPGPSVCIPGSDAMTGAAGRQQRERGPLRVRRR